MDSKNLEPLISNDFLYLKNNLDRVDDLVIKGLPEDTISFEIVFENDDLGMIMVELPGHIRHYVLTTSSLTDHKELYVDDKFLRRIELRREIKSN